MTESSLHSSERFNDEIKCYFRVYVSHCFLSGIIRSWEACCRTLKTWTPHCCAIVNYKILLSCSKGAELELRFLVAAAQKPPRLVQCTPMATGRFPQIPIDSGLDAWELCCTNCSLYIIFIYLFLWRKLFYPVCHEDDLSLFFFN